MPVDKDAHRAYIRRTIIIAGGVDNDAEEQDQHNHGSGKIMSTIYTDRQVRRLLM
jgi:hypothetical protein